MKTRKFFYSLLLIVLTTSTLSAQTLWKMMTKLPTVCFSHQESLRKNRAANFAALKMKC